MSNEAREIIVLEILGEQISGEHRRIPHHEARSVLVPGDHVLYAGVLDELIGLGQERRRRRPLRLTALVHRWLSHIIILEVPEPFTTRSDRRHRCFSESELQQQRSTVILETSIFILKGGILIEFGGKEGEERRNAEEGRKTVENGKQTQKIQKEATSLSFSRNFR